MVYFGEEHKFF